MEFSRVGQPFFRYDGGESGFVRLYLVIQKAPEDENFMVGTI
jgi:hypothetical protein